MSADVLKKLQPCSDLDDDEEDDDEEEEIEEGGEVVAKEEGKALLQGDKDKKGRHLPRRFMIKLFLSKTLFKFFDYLQSLSSFTSELGCFYV